MCDREGEGERKPDKKREGQIVHVRGRVSGGFHLKQDSLPCICQSTDGGLVANGNVEGS